MNLWKLIKQRVNEGWSFEIGQHTEGLQGYYAFCVSNDTEDCCEECGEPTSSWDTSGHALTISDAVKMADRIAQGEEVKVPDAKEFGAVSFIKKGD